MRISFFRLFHFQPRPRKQTPARRCYCRINRPATVWSGATVTRYAERKRADWLYWTDDGKGV